MLLKGKVKTLYFDDEGNRVKEPTENFVKMKTSLTYRQANMFYNFLADPKYQELTKNKKKKDGMDAEAIMQLMPIFIDLLSQTIIDWSAVDDNGEKIPINTDTINDLEFSIMTELINELMVIFNMQKEESDKAVDEVKN
jgi:hypothetical protein